MIYLKILYYNIYFFKLCHLGFLYNVVYRSGDVFWSHWGLCGYILPVSQPFHPNSPRATFAE